MKKIIFVLAIFAVASPLAFFWLNATPASPTNFVLAPSKTIPRNAPLRIEAVYPTPRLTRGPTGSWDSVDLLNPSVIRYKGQLYNYYSGFDGKVWRTGLAFSDDEVNWKKHEKNPVLSPSSEDWDVSYISANGAAALWNGKVFYFYQGIDRNGTTNIGLSTSEDGYTFQKLPQPVLTPGPLHTWDSSDVGDPYVISKGGILYMFYLGQNNKLVQRLGVARSEDGVSWAKLVSNPILDVGASGTFDENGLGEPSVAHVPPYFYLIYTGRDAHENRNIGYALSTDGVNWKKMSTHGLLSSDQRGNWASHVVCDTTLLSKGNGKFLVWFGGGDKPQGAQNLNGDVGLLTLDLGQNRNMAEFDANADWERIPAKPSEILQGSYGIEGEPNKHLIWVGPKALITLQPESKQQDKELVVRGWVPGTMIAQVTKQADPIVISLVVKGQTLAKSTSSRDEMIDISVPWSNLQPLFTSGQVGFDLEIYTSRSFVPAEFGRGKDTRDLAFAVSSIRFE
ncbi:MAG: hypothetical protein ABIU05_19130 [Nitrospirales bacterium]